MGKIRTIELTEQQRAALIKGYKHGAPRVFSQRCHMVLLKSEGRSSRDVAQILGVHLVSVNKWLSRYEQEGLEGLKTKPGRGRKPILQPHHDSEIVREVVKQERQRLKQAKAILEHELGKEFSLKTLKRFLKNLSADTSGYA